MDFLLSNLSFLAKQGKLQPAEQILSEKLSAFEVTIPEDLSEQDIQKVESVLISLMQINKGVLSMQFSARLGECFIFLYKLKNAPKMFNFVTAVCKNPSQCSFYTAGFLVLAIGQSSKSLVSTLAESMLKNTKKYENPVLFSLNYCFKACRGGKEMAKYVKKVYSLVSSCIIPEKKLPTQLLAIKLLKRTIPYTDDISNEKRLRIVTPILSDATYSPLVAHKASELIASIYLQEISEAKEKLPHAFEEIRKLKNNAHVIQYSITYMDNTLLQENAELLLDGIRSDAFSLVEPFSRLLSVDTKKTLFEKVEKENANCNQLTLLQHLVYDDESLRTLSAIATQIITTKRNDREEALAFFRDLPHKNQELAAEVIRSSSLFLAYPPERHKKLGRQIVGMSMIVSLLLISDRRLLTDDVKELLTQFQKSVFVTGNILKGSYVGAFIVAKAIILVDDQLIKNSLKHVIHYFNTKTASYASKEELLTSAVSCFLVTHRSRKYVPLLAEVLSKNPNSTATVRMLLAVMHSEMSPVLFNFINNFCCSIVAPPKEFRILRLNNKLIPDEILFTPIKYEPKRTKVTLKMEDSEIAVIVCENYADFALNAPAECRDFSFLLKPVPKLDLLFALASNPRTISLLPNEGALPALFSMLNKSNINEDIVTIQMICQIISAYSQKDKNFATIVKTMKSLDPAKKSLLAASLFSSPAVTDSFILDILNELNDIAKTDYCKYALHALTSLFRDCMTAAISLRISATECRFMLAILHSQQMLDPTNLMMAVLMFSALLPIISSEGDKDLKEVVNDIFQCFSGTRTPFSLQSLLRVSSQILAFSRSTISVERLRFPSEHAGKMPMTIASDTYSELINSYAGKDPRDFFEYVARSIFSMQCSDESRCQKFVESSASVSPKLNEWVSLYKDCLAKSNIPNTTIDPSTNVKLTLLAAMRHTLNRIADAQELNTEALDDVITSLTRTVGSCDNNNVLREAFARFADVVRLFKSRKSEETGQCLLDLYDSQFSIAVRNAFKGINVSEVFLSEYLDFLAVDNNQLSHAIDCYCGCLVSDSKHPPAIRIISKLINYVIGDKEKEDMLNELCESSADKLVAIIDRAISIFNENDWKNISAFRTEYMTSFAGIIRSMIWIQSRSEKVYITDTRLMTFLTEDLQRTTEMWRVEAEIRGIIACFKFMKELPDIFRYQSLVSVPKNHKLTSEFIACFADRLVKDDPQIKNFVDYCNEVKDVPMKAYAEIIYKAHDSFISSEYKNLFAKVQGYPKVCTILFLRTKNINQDFFIEEILKMQENSVEIAHRLLAATKNVDDRISDLILGDFENKGFEVIGSLLSSKETEECGLRLLEKFTPNEGKEAENKERFATFLLLAVQYVKKHPIDNFALYAIDMAAKLALDNESSVSKPAIAALATLRRDAEPLLRSKLQNNCKELVECLEKKVESAKPKKVVLKALGSTKSRRQADEGEWQTLDDDFD